MKIDWKKYLFIFFMISIVCKNCKIRALISDNATAKGIALSSPKDLGACTIGLVDVDSKIKPTTLSTTPIQWQSHSMAKPVPCTCCGKILPALKRHERHHCRACGHVICKECKTYMQLDVIITKNGLQTSIGLVDVDSKIKPTTSPTTPTTPTPTAAVSSTKHSRPHQRHHQHRMAGDSTTCTSCGLGIPDDLRATFDWSHMLQQSRKQPASKEENEEYALFCHRCAFGHHDQRGGLRAASVFVTRLSPNIIGALISLFCLLIVLCFLLSWLTLLTFHFFKPLFPSSDNACFLHGNTAEDLHATLDDHFGGVQRVHIPRSEDGKPKTDGDGFAFAQVFFYKTPSAPSSSQIQSLNVKDEHYPKWSNSGGLMSCLRTGWCWNGISKGQRCRIHHGIHDESNTDNENENENELSSSSVPTGSMALRSKMSLSDHVRHTQGDHGSFQTYADEARERLRLRSVALQTKEIRDQQTEIFKFKSNDAPFNLAKMACQHNDVHSMLRLLKLNTQAVSYDAKLRRQLFDPYTLGLQGRTLLHIACVHGSFDVLNLLLSDTCQASAMTIRAQQQRALAQAKGGTDAASDEGDIFEKAVNQSDSSGFTPLHLVCLSNTPETVRAIQLLLDRGGDPNSRTSRGETSLYFAAKNNNIAAVAELVAVTELSSVLSTLKSLGNIAVDVERLLKERIKRN